MRGRRPDACAVAGGSCSPGARPAEWARRADRRRARCPPDALSREALAQLSQIAALIPIAAVLAAAAAIGALIWQRRPRLAKLRLEGLPRGDLWLTILLESVLLLGVGCVIGTIFGIYGQQLADRALAETINFPVTHSVVAPGALSSLALVPATALAIPAIPGYLAASVSAALALQD